MKDNVFQYIVSQDASADCAIVSTEEPQGLSSYKSIKADKLIPS